MSATPITRPPVSSPTRTGRRQWSTELLREWAAKIHPGKTLLENVRLGPTTIHLVGVTVNPALEAALRVSNWFADGVLETDDAVLIIEAKVKPNPGAIGQALFYLRLSYSTPALQTAMGKPFRPAVLFAESDDTVTAWASSLGVQVFIYTPAWIADYLQSVQLRNRVTNPQNVIPAT